MSPAGEEQECVKTSCSSWPSFVILPLFLPLPSLYLSSIAGASVFRGASPLPSPTWVGHVGKKHTKKKKERKLGKRKKSKVIKILGLCSDIRYLQFHSHFSEKYTSQLREAWIQGFTSVAQGFQRLRVGVLSFPLGINVALTSSELSGKDPRRRNLPWPRGYLLSKRNRVLL